MVEYDPKKICLFILAAYGSFFFFLMLTLANCAVNKGVRSSSKVTRGEWEAPACER